MMGESVMHIWASAFASDMQILHEDLQPAEARLRGVRILGENHVAQSH